MMSQTRQTTSTAAKPIELARGDHVASTRPQQRASSGVGQHRTPRCSAFAARSTTDDCVLCSDATAPYSPLGAEGRLWPRMLLISRLLVERDAPALIALPLNIVRCASTCSTWSTFDAPRTCVGRRAAVAAVVPGAGAQRQPKRRQT
jgi:hypothetical protein